MKAIEIAMAMEVSAQLNKRQSGFASATNRIGKKRIALSMMIAIGHTLIPVGRGNGRVCQCFQIRYSARNGTLQPYPYCGLSDHSAFNWLITSSQSHAKTSRL